MEQKKKQKNPYQISAILTKESFERMQETVKNFGISRTDFLNNACCQVPIIGLAETKGILKEFIKIRVALESGTLSDEDRKAGESICRSLDSLTKAISSLEI